LLLENVARLAARSYMPLAEAVVGLSGAGRAVARAARRVGARRNFILDLELVCVLNA
jgi:tRNA A37 threonylcarbamoyladenosine dehydratase